MVPTPYSSQVITGATLEKLGHFDWLAYLLLRDKEDCQPRRGALCSNNFNNEEEDRSVGS